MNIEVNINRKLAILNEFITKKKSATASRVPETSRLITASMSNSNNVKLANFEIRVI